MYSVAKSLVRPVNYQTVLLFSVAFNITACPAAQMVTTNRGPAVEEAVFVKETDNSGENIEDDRVQSNAVKEETDSEQSAESSTSHSSQPDFDTLETADLLNPERLSSFFKALDETRNRSKKRLVRILHFGDSHTAADILPSAVRRTLQSKFGDGGRGFVFLGKPWKAYKPLDVVLIAHGSWITRRVFAASRASTIDGRYGLGGMATEASPKGASAKADILDSAAFCKKASTFEVIYLKQPGGGKFRLIVDGKRRSVVNTDHGEYESGFRRITTKSKFRSFEIKISAGEQVRLFGAVIESRGPGVVYDVLGINGAFFYTPIRWNKDIFVEQVAHRSPDLIVTMYGTNEANANNLTEDNYYKRVKEATTLLTDGAKGASCLILGPLDRKMPKNDVEEEQLSRLNLITNVQRKVADELGCGFLDLRQLMGGQGAYREWRTKGLAQADGVHLTVSGYQYMGELIADKIIKAYDSYRHSDSTLNIAKRNDSASY